MDKVTAAMVLTSLSTSPLVRSPPVRQNGEPGAQGTGKGPLTSGAELLFEEALFFFSFSSPFFPFFVPQLFFNDTAHEHTRILKFSHVLHKPSQCQPLPKGSRSQQFGTHPSRLWSLHLRADSFLTHTMDAHPLVGSERKCERNGPWSYQPPPYCPKDPTASHSYVHPLSVYLLASTTLPAYL